MITTRILSLSLLSFLLPLLALAAEPPAAENSARSSTLNSTPNSTLTAVPGIAVGHFTHDARPTGCTVVLVEDGAVAGVDVRGGAPGTRETDLLDPVKTVAQVHAVVLSGGSAFGLATADGVMRYLEEKGVGFPTRVARVPIVPAAILFDLGIGDPKIRPDAAAGYAAAKAASTAPVEEGSVGAGAGATVGKLMGPQRAMRGGVGSAAIQRADGLVVAALVAVNAVGDVIDPTTGEVIAGVRDADGALVDLRQALHQGLDDPLTADEETSSGENTTIGVVATNARLTQAEATKVAQMAHDGMARAIYPSHTPWDGDTIFALATGDFAGEADLATVGTLAADAVAEAIVRAVEAARSLPGLPAATDLED